MQKNKKIEISVVVGLIFSILFSIVGFGMSCSDIRSSVLRLHILANSDSQADQAIKLVIRDELLKCGNEIFKGDVSVESAQSYFESNREELTVYINNILKRNGFGYNSEICLVNEYFTTRSYDDFTLPAGEYLALKVILGKGQGHNWWCVMFPPLCLPAAAENTDLDLVFDKNSTKILESSSEYEIRFRIIEVIEWIKSKYADHQ